ncbi:TTAGGG repeat binding factor, partial [Ascosphaera aggregata]
GQGALYLELKTQAFVSGLLSNVRSSDQLLNEFFPEDLEQHLLMRRQNMKQLAPSELDFVKRCQSRRDIILNEMRSANASNTLQERYQWGNFLKELCGFIGKNFEGLNHHKKQAKPQQGQQQQQIQEQQKSQLQQQQIQHTEQGINQPSQFAVTATTSIYPPPAPSSVNTGGLFDASTPAPTHNHYQQPSQQESPSYGFLQPSSTSPLSTSSTVTSAPVSASSPAIAPPFAPDPAPAPTSTPTQTAAKQSQESNQPSPSPGPSRSSFSSDLVARAARAAQIALQGQLIKSKQKPESPQMRTQPQPSPNLQTQAQQLPQEQQQQQQVNQTQQPQPQAPLPTQQVQQVQPQERLQQPQVPSPNRQQLLLPAQLNQPHQIIQHQPQPLPTQVQPPSQSQPQLQPQPFTQSQASSVQVNQSVQPASLPSRPFRLHVSQHFQVVTQQQLDQKFGVSSPSHAPSPAHDVHTPTSIAQPLPPQPQAVIQQPFSAQPPIPQQTPASRPQPVQIKFQHTPPLQFHQYTPPSSLASHSSASGQYQVQNSFTYAPGLPHYSQSQPTQVLYERARQAASARPAPSRRSILPSQRRPWTTEEENALMAGLDRVKGPHWAQILQMFGPGGTINETLKDRNQVQLKDKARNLKLFFLKSGIEVPYYLKFVTGELKTRAPAQAAKQEARERERQRGEEDQAHVEGVEGMMALSNRHSLNFTPGVKPPAPTQQAPITLPHGLPPVSQQVPPPQLQSQPQQYPSQTRTTYTQQVTDNIVAAPPQADTPTAEQVMKRALMQSIAADIKNEPIPYQPSSPSLAAQPQQQQQQQPLESSSTQDLASKPASEFSLQYPPEASAQSFQQTENNTDNNQIQRLLQSDQDQKLEQAVEITQLGQPQQPQQPEQLDAFQMVVHLQTHNEQHTQQQLNAQALNQPTLSPSSQAV